MRPWGMTPSNIESMISNQSRILAVLLMVIVGGSVRAEDAKEVVVANAQELKGIKAKKITWKKDGAKMVRIPWISSYTKYGDPNFEPFYMDTTEVTVGQFKKFLKSSDYEPKKPINWEKLYEYSPTDEHPMIYVSWFDAQAYCEWAGKRLPREAEWEFAARGGLKNKEFPWGDEESIAREYANFSGVLGRDQWDETTAPVGSFRANGYGLHDMAGNVWEWCASWYSEDKKHRVLRGGTWRSLAIFLRVAYRNFTCNPIFINVIGGFRCVSGSK